MNGLFRVRLEDSLSFLSNQPPQSIGFDYADFASKAQHPAGEELQALNLKRHFDLVLIFDLFHNPGRYSGSREAVGRG